MDRIIPRLTQHNEECVFLIDSIEDGNITMWQPHKEPVDVSLEYYHGTKPILDDKLSEKVCWNYSHTWGVQIQCMQRLPRNFRKTFGLPVAKQSSVIIDNDTNTARVIPDNVRTEAHKSVKSSMTEQERAYYAAVKAKNGRWEVLDSIGEVAAFATDIKGAMMAMERLARH